MSLTDTRASAMAVHLALLWVVPFLISVNGSVLITSRHNKMSCFSDHTMFLLKLKRKTDKSFILCNIIIVTWLRLKKVICAAKVQNTRPLICMSLNKNSDYCYIPRSSKQTDTFVQCAVLNLTAVARNRNSQTAKVINNSATKL